MKLIALEKRVKCVTRKNTHPILIELNKDKDKDENRFNDINRLIYENCKKEKAKRNFVGDALLAFKIFNL